MSKSERAAPARKAETRIAELEKTCSKYATEVARLEFKVGELQAEINRLHAELNRRRGTRQQMHELYRALDDAIIARIDRRGFARKQPKLSDTQLTIQPQDVDKKDKAALMAIARQYDIQAYFRYRSARTGMKLQYRIVSKLYRTARDVGVFGLKKSYRLARRIAR